ncbi:MAG: hypothetical protein HY335_00185 [Deinococcus sp.]|nr:hypothetical protein [Deinococcus sp.]
MRRTRSQMQPVHRLAEVPQFASEAEEAEFWATHYLSDELVAKLSKVEIELTPELRQQIQGRARQRARLTAIRLSEDVLARIKAIAERRGIGYQTLIKLWVAERLEQEERGRPGI